MAGGSPVRCGSIRSRHDAAAVGDEALLLARSRAVLGGARPRRRMPRRRGGRRRGGPARRRVSEPGDREGLVAARHRCRIRLRQRPGDAGRAVARAGRGRPGARRRHRADRRRRPAASGARGRPPGLARRAGAGATQPGSAARGWSRSPASAGRPSFSPACGGSGPRWSRRTRSPITTACRAEIRLRREAEAAGARAGDDREGLGPAAGGGARGIERFGSRASLARSGGYFRRSSRRFSELAAERSDSDPGKSWQAAPRGDIVAAQFGSRAPFARFHSGTGAPMRLSILDDYQGVALDMADWSPVRGARHRDRGRAPPVRRRGRRGARARRLRDRLRDARAHARFRRASSTGCRS